MNYNQKVMYIGLLANTHYVPLTTHGAAFVQAASSKYCVQTTNKQSIYSNFTLKIPHIALSFTLDNTLLDAGSGINEMHAVLSARYLGENVQCCRFLQILADTS